MHMSKLYTGPHLASWSDVTTGPLTRVNIYDIVNYT
jgi:hypothetical protein